MTTIIVSVLLALVVAGLAWFGVWFAGFIRDGRCMYMHFIGAIGPK